MEEVESNSHLPSITSYVFYFIEVEAACFAILRDCNGSTGITGGVGYGTFPYPCIVEHPFHFASSIFFCWISSLTIIQK